MVWAFGEDLRMSFREDWLGGEGIAALSHRRALKNLGPAVTVCASGSCAQFVVSPRLEARRSEPSPSPREGVLLPRSRLYPKPGQSVLDGMALAPVIPSGRPLNKYADLVPSWIGKDTGTLISQTQALIDARVDVLFGIVSPRMVRWLRPILVKNRTSFIVAEADAHAVHPSKESPPSTRFTVDFFRAFSSSRIVNNFPLHASGAAVDEAVFSQVGDSTQGVRSILPWGSGLDTALNNSFARLYRRNFGRSANAFAVLGFGTVRLIDEAVKTIFTSAQLCTSTFRHWWQ